MKKKHYLVYKTTNLVNGKIYIGKHETDNLDDGYLGSGILIQRAIEKYGKENFKREILFECSSREEMNAKEAELVNEEFLKLDDVYNIKLGGEGGWDYVIANNLHRNPQSHSIGGQAFARQLKENKTFRESISNGLRKFHNEHPEHRIKMRNAIKNIRPMLGKHLSEESKYKIGYKNSSNQRGINNSNYGKHWVSDIFNEICYPMEKSILLEDYQLAMRILNFDEYRVKRANE